MMLLRSSKHRRNIINLKHNIGEENMNTVCTFYTPIYVPSDSHLCIRAHMFSLSWTTRLCRTLRVM